MKLPDWLRSFLRGAGSILDLSPTIPSYVEMFGTDEQLLADDQRRLQQDHEKAMKQLLKDEEVLALAHDLLQQDEKSVEPEEPT